MLGVPRREERIPSTERAPAGWKANPQPSRLVETVQAAAADREHGTCAPWHGQADEQADEWSLIEQAQALGIAARLR
jgi:hypothetical protein